MAALSIIPVIDFGNYDAGDRNTLAEEICHTLSTVGFMYIKNHGVPCHQIQMAVDESLIFFRQSMNEKLKSTMSEGYLGATTGYNEIGAEQLDPTTTKEIREAFDLVRHQKLEVPDSPHFIPALLALDQSLRELAMKILHCIGLGLHLSDEHMFENCHENVTKRITDSNTGTRFRTLYYPPYTRDSDDANIVRLGAHTDYGTITLLCQDNVGGLEIETTENVFVPAIPIPGTVLVNIGDLLQRWTSDQLRATKHRVLCNDSQQSRQSIVMFVHPDGDTMVQSLDGKNKYTPIRAMDHLMERYNATYK